MVESLVQVKTEMRKAGSLAVFVLLAWNSAAAYAAGEFIKCRVMYDVKILSAFLRLVTCHDSKSPPISTLISQNCQGVRLEHLRSSCPALKVASKIHIHLHLWGVSLAMVGLWTSMIIFRLRNAAHQTGTGMTVKARSVDFLAAVDQ